MTWADLPRGCSARLTGARRVLQVTLGLGAVGRQGLPDCQTSSGCMYARRREWPIEEGGIGGRHWPGGSGPPPTLAGTSSVSRCLCFGPEPRRPPLCPAASPSPTLCRDPPAGSPRPPCSVGYAPSVCSIAASQPGASSRP